MIQTCSWKSELKHFSLKKIRFFSPDNFKAEHIKLNCHNSRSMITGSMAENANTNLRTHIDARTHVETHTHTQFAHACVLANSCTKCAHHLLPPSLSTSSVPCSFYLNMKKLPTLILSFSLSMIQV